MGDYGPNEIVDMIMILGESRNNYAAAARLYAERYPNRRHPSNGTIQTLTQRARNGAFVRHRRHHEYDENDPRVITILAIIHLDSHINIRQIERDIGIPQSTASRILGARKYHPYHITLTKQLTPNDMILQVRFCRWAIRMIQQDQDFFRHVLFSDESTFRNTGELNRNNCHYLSDENPHWLRPIYNQHCWSVIVLCGIINGYLIGPYFFAENVNGVNFLKLLRDILPELLENVDLATRLRMWIQLDGAPPHYARIVCD
ncbi:hypothetical protein TSAR_000769 [Trichomalopsis sarcophagae]|uniref:DUF4817 domain-containing protein n=1 Tax=Trichomalopsis sarcophagae TaxID=543379 RepID=A0A232EH98_9HYME|nr:hypothetical protein TSAR_000769 [Trichomalopsis sarcophagae]